MTAFAIVALSLLFFQSPGPLGARFVHHSASPPHVTVLVQTPHYALMKFSNGDIDGWHGNGYLLAERYSFGWQLLAANENDRFTSCTIQKLGIPSSVGQQMRAFLSTAHASRDGCGPASEKDYGPSADVIAVRRAMAGTAEVIGPVRVIGFYAVGEHVNDGGGETFLKKVAGRWKVLADGGGALQPRDLHSRFGVPLNVATELLSH